MPRGPRRATGSARRAGYGVCGHGPVCTREACREYPRSVLKKIARRRKESSIQAAVLGVFRAHGILCWPQNREKGGRNRAVHVGFKGLPDIGGVLPSGRAFFAEVKRPGETLTPHQLGARALLNKVNAYVCCVRSVEEATACATDALTPRPEGAR